MGIYKHIACVIRAHNNNPDAIKAVVRALYNGVGTVIVVVKGHDESNRGRVRMDIDQSEGITYLGRERVIVIEMMNGYSWSNALNVALARIAMMNAVARRKFTQQIKYVLNVSVEVLWERSHLDTIFHKMVSNEEFGVVGTSFQGHHRGTIIDLGLSYSMPRNTMMLIRWSAIQCVGYFDAWCDGTGGMEDFHFILRMLILGNFEWTQLDLSVPLKVGVNYDQQQKEARELAAMHRIIKYVESHIGEDDELTEQLYNGLLRLGAKEL